MRAPSLGRKLYSSLMFVFVSVLGGLLAAGLAVPTAGMVSEMTKLGATALDQVPAELETPPQAQGSKVLMGNGEVLTNFYEEYRVYVPLSDVSDSMKQAQISIEDRRFYEHGAIDVIGTLRALGFPRRSILLSFLVESMLIALVAGLIGCGLGLFANWLPTAATGNVTFSELAFAFSVTPRSLVFGMVFALTMGLVGGLLPALRAALLPITKALRDA